MKLGLPMSDPLCKTVLGHSPLGNEWLCVKANVLLVHLGKRKSRQGKGRSWEALRVYHQLPFAPRRLTIDLEKASTSSSFLYNLCSQPILCTSPCIVRNTYCTFPYLSYWKIWHWSKERGTEFFEIETQIVKPFLEEKFLIFQHY